jgi:hypothetical protein
MIPPTGITGTYRPIGFTWKYFGPILAALFIVALVLGILCYKSRPIP